MTGIQHLERIEITPERLLRWQEAATALGADGLALGLELLDVTRDPTRHMLRRAATAARQAERITSGDQQLIANAVATELEDAAEGSPHV